MPSDVSLVDVRKSFQAIAGLESMTEMDNFFFEQSLNRAVRRAYDQSPVWPRYLVVSEARDIISLTVSGLATGSSSDRSSVINGNYILLGQEQGQIGGVAGTNVYYNPAVGTESGSGIQGSTVIYKRASTNRWEIENASSINFNSNGTIDVQAGSGDTILVEADTSKKDNPSEVVTWSLTATLVSGTPLVVDEQLIPYAQTGKDTIGDFNRIHRKRAFLNNSAIEYDFYVDSSGANVLNITSTTDSKAHVTYKKKYSSSFTETSTDVPAEFFDYITYTALSDFYTGDGQTEKAIIADEAATKMLDRELMKLDMYSNRNVITQKFSTYVNHQSR
tara:strand:- start:234 stop:1232 length:999 start_codon:yes stop_codon:yes gene_type:complete